MSNQCTVNGVTEGGGYLGFVVVGPLDEWDATDIAAEFDRFYACWAAFIE